MYILTQNKKTIIISNNITNIYIKESSFLIGDNKNTTSKKINTVNTKLFLNKEKHYYLYCNTVNEEKVILGLYSSMERCSEILNDILLKLKEDEQIYEIPNK